MSHFIRLALSGAPFLFASLLALSASAQGQPATSPAASTAAPAAPPAPAAPTNPAVQPGAPAAAQPTAPPSGYGPPPAQAGAQPPPPHPYGYPAYGPPAGHAPPGVYGPPPPPPPAEQDAPAKRNVAITMSPIHLILPVFEATIEVRAHDHVGIALIGGYGKVKVKDIFQSYTFDVYELGGQLLFYPISKFDKGLQLGAEALYIHVGTADNYAGDQVTVSGAAGGIAVGPLVGYKVCTSGGFTFVAQGGVQFMTAKAEAKDSNGATATKDANDIFPLINLNLGWSF